MVIVHVKLSESIMREQLLFDILCLLLGVKVVLGVHHTGITFAWHFVPNVRFKCILFLVQAKHWVKLSVEAFFESEQED